VSRIFGISENYEMELILDVNVDLYPIEIGARFSLALASTLNIDGTPDEPVYDQSVFQKPTLLDKYEYAMYGKVFKYSEERQPTVKVYVISQCM
jgi:DNA-directed RNA polymerase I, II, and III subunit RPABC3